MRKLFGFYLMMLVLVAPLLSGCGLPSLVARAAPPQAESQTAPAAVPTAVMETSASPFLSEFQTTLETIYKQVNPSVVNIQVVQQATTPAASLPEIPGFPFFFGLPNNTPQTPQVRYGAGSGFVWSNDGYIVTNNHVVADAEKITVTFADGTSALGKVVGADPDSDLAVLKVDLPADRLQPVRLADSNQVQVGQLAVAIGNPFALEGTMTVGFVSALGRLLPVDSGNGQSTGYSIPDVIQTDAPINPGNSGGVLVDDQGQVIGVTSAIISPSQASAGIGFAIPSAIVSQVVPTLIKTGHYEHPWLGISGASLNLDLDQAAGLDSNQHGALVVNVVPGSPADQAGLQGSDRQVQIDGQPYRVGGDIITAIDGQPVNRFDDLITYLVRSTKVGQQVTLTVIRQGKEKQLKVDLVARPKPDQSGPQSENVVSQGVWLGINGATMTPELSQAMHLSANQQGVLVGQVEAGSPADQAGLRGSYNPVTINGQQLLVGGDIITAVDGQPVANIAELQSLIQQSEPGQKIALTILRNGKQMEVPVTLGTMSPGS